MANDDDDTVFLFGDSIEKPHIRFERGKYLVVSPYGSQKLSGVPDGRQERPSPPLTKAQARQLAIRLLVALEPEL